MSTTVSFDASTSEGGNGKAIIAYDWDFGDTLHGAGATVSHDYENSGEYNITLTVTNECGETDSLIQCIYVPTVVVQITFDTTPKGASVYVNETYIGIT